MNQFKEVELVGRGLGRLSWSDFLRTLGRALAGRRAHRLAFIFFPGSVGARLFLLLAQPLFFNFCGFRLL